MKNYTYTLDIRNIDLLSEFTRILQNDSNFSRYVEDKTQPPDLLIHELSRDYQSDLKKLEAEIEQTGHTEVFIVSERTDPEILIPALRIGIKEFLSVPLAGEQVTEALKHFRERQEKKEQKKSKKQGKIISVVGSKGGVGVTTIAVNLAVSIARRQDVPSVALLDMNTLFGEVPVFLDITPKYTWGDVTKNIQRLDAMFLLDTLTKHETGVHILPSPRYIDKQPPPSPPVVETMLKLMKKNYDFIVVDLGQTINETNLKIIQMSYLIQLIAIQSLPCLSNTNRLITSYTGYGYTRKETIHVVLNRFFNKSEVSVDTVQEGIGQDLAWIIPNDYTTTMSAINSGQPICSIAPRSKILKSFEDYIEQFFVEAPKIKKKKRWLF